MSEALPGSFQLTARALGVTTQALGDMLQKGQVLSDVWAVKFAQQLNKEAGPAVERLGVGAARLGNVMKELSTIVGGPFARAWDTAANSLATFLSRMVGVGTAIDETNRKIRAQTGATIQELERLNAAERERLRVAGLPDPRGTRATGRDAQLEILRRANQRAIEHEAEVARFGRGVAEDDRAKKAAAAQKVLEESFKKTQEQQEKYFASLAKIMDESELLTTKTAALTRTYNELLEQIEQLTDADTAQREVLINQAIAIDKQLDANEKRLAQIRKEAQHQQELTEQQQRDADAAKQRDLEARERLEATNIGLKQTADAQRDFEEARRAMSETERDAANAHLRSAEAIAAENKGLRERKALRELEEEGEKTINQLNRRLAALRGNIEAEREYAIALKVGTPAQKEKIELLNQEIIAQEKLNDWLKEWDKVTEAQRPRPLGDLQGQLARCDEVEPRSRHDHPGSHRQRHVVGCRQESLRTRPGHSLNAQFASQRSADEDRRHVGDRVTPRVVVHRRHDHVVRRRRPHGRDQRRRRATRGRSLQRELRRPRAAVM